MNVAGNYNIFYSKKNGFYQNETQSFIVELPEDYESLRVSVRTHSGTQAENPEKSPFLSILSVITMDWPLRHYDTELMRLFFPMNSHIDHLEVAVQVQTQSLDFGRGLS